MSFLDTIPALAGLTPLRRRILVGTVALVTVVELALAWSTAGTYDIAIWRSFAETVSRIGPIEIYSLDDAGLMVYNHPPLIGWWLTVVNAGSGLGVPFGFLIRLPSIASHVAAVFLILAMVTRRRPEHAWASAIAVAASPLLVIIAGFHGNNDPVMATLLLTSVWLLADRRAPALAGLAFSLAVSVKIIPLVVLPILLIVACAQGQPDPRPDSPPRSVFGALAPRDHLRRFVLGGLPVFVLLWVPPLVLATKGYLSHVMLYNGSGFPRQWGPYQFAEGLGLPQVLLDLYVRPGTYAVVLVCALLPAWLIRHTPDRAPLAVATSLSLLMLISPAWAAQYVAWIAAAVFLIAFRPALGFTIGAGAVYITLYIWWLGDVRPLTTGQIWVLAIGWIALVPVVVAGLRALARDRPPAPAAPRTIGA
jgi:Glycosyltransferase family 87